MERIQKDEVRLQKYLRYCEALKLDAKMVLLSFISSVVIILLSHIEFVSSVLRPWFWLSLGLFFLVLSVLSISEIIESLFTLNIIRINLVDERIKGHNNPSDSKANAKTRF